MVEQMITNKHDPESKDVLDEMRNQADHLRKFIQQQQSRNKKSQK